VQCFEVDAAAPLAAQPTIGGTPHVSDDAIPEASTPQARGIKVLNVGKL